MRFIVDGMLGSLTRWLRILGHDVKYSTKFVDNELLEIAGNEDRILLTRDVELLQRAKTHQIRAFCVEEKDEAERLAHLAQKCSIKLDVDASVSRCPICGSPLHQVDKECICDKVPSGTMKRVSKFWGCDGCGKIYWQGTHWKQINETLNKAKKIIELESS